MIESVAGSGIFFAGFRGERRVVNGMKTQKPLKGASHMKSSGKAEITNRKADTGAKRLRATIAAMSLVALALSLSNARAQDKASPPRTEATSVEPKGYDLEITNGILAGKGSSTGSKASLTLVVDRLRESYPQANIAMPPTLGGLPIGELKLRTG